MLWIRFCTIDSLPPLRRCSSRLLRFLRFLLVLPGTRIAQAAPAGALARPAKVLGEVLCGDLREELFLVRAADDLDLAYGDFVEPGLDDGPDGAERPGRVDDVELAHDLRVAVLADRGRLEDVVLDAVKIGQRHALQVQDRAERLDGVPDRAPGRGHALARGPLVLADQPVQQPLLRRDRVQRLDVQLSELLNVNRSSVLKN